MGGSGTNLPLWLAFLSLNEQATRDWLTGLYNRRYFEETLADHIEAAGRYKRDLSLILFDIDCFKQINDAQGHEAGDAVLQHFAQAIKATARKADIVCRLGGDEFAVILPETNRTRAERFAERLLQIAETPATAGIASLPCENLITDADADLLVRKAERRQ